MVRRLSYCFADVQMLEDSKVFCLHDFRIGRYMRKRPPHDRGFRVLRFDSGAG